MHTISDKQLYQASQLVASTLQELELTLSSAESCTGGWLAKCCTDLPASSQWFSHGFTTYSNASKQGLLGVNSATIDTFGAVSEQTVIEMVNGALTDSNSSISVAITGIAGPEGGSPDKPIGTVWFAWKKRQAHVVTALHQFDGDRESVRRQAVMTALQGIVKNARD